LDPRSFFSKCSGALPTLPSFPTRRSSDLTTGHANSGLGQSWIGEAFPAKPQRLQPDVAQPPLQGDEQVGPPSPVFRFDGRRKFRSEEHTSELQSRSDLVCRLLLEKKNNST